MDEKIFEKLGFTKGETKVYLALSRLGQTTVTPIVFESKVTKSKIYDILEKLISKGLVGYITSNGKKRFFANDPHMIVEYLEKKKEDIVKTQDEMNKIIPRLIAERNSVNLNRVAEIFEGFQGIKTIREELMHSFKSSDTFFVLGAPKIANEKWEGWLLDFHKRRIAKNIKMKIIYNANAKEYGHVRTKMRLTEVKYLPNNLVTPNWIDIFPEAVMMTIILKEPIAFIVRNKELAESFKSYFSIMWNSSIK